MKKDDWYWSVEPEQYDEAMDWAIQEVMDMLNSLDAMAFTQQQWQDLYFALFEEQFDEAYLEHLQSNEDDGTF